MGEIFLIFAFIYNYPFRHSTNRADADSDNNAIIPYVQRRSERITNRNSNSVSSTNPLETSVILAAAHSEESSPSSSDLSDASGVSHYSSSLDIAVLHKSLLEHLNWEIPNIYTPLEIIQNKSFNDSNQSDGEYYSTRFALIMLFTTNIIL